MAVLSGFWVAQCSEWYPAPAGCRTCFYGQAFLPTDSAVLAQLGFHVLQPAELHVTFLNNHGGHLFAADCSRGSWWWQDVHVPIAKPHAAPKAETGKRKRDGYERNRDMTLVQTHLYSTSTAPEPTGPRACCPSPFPPLSARRFSLPRPPLPPGCAARARQWLGELGVPGATEGLHGHRKIAGQPARISGQTRHSSKADMHCHMGSAPSDLRTVKHLSFRTVKHLCGHTQHGARQHYCALKGLRSMVNRLSAVAHGCRDCWVRHRQLRCSNRHALGQHVPGQKGSSDCRVPTAGDAHSSCTEQS